MTTEAIYQEIRECIQYRIKQAQWTMDTTRGVEHIQAGARIHAYETILEDLYASQANMEASHA